jgi:hypothetical protein
MAMAPRRPAGILQPNIRVFIDTLVEHLLPADCANRTQRTEHLSWR